ncbi:MAG TPA: alpha/beta hydrolase, partial [Polyangiaceae bacterium]
MSPLIHLPWLGLLALGAAVLTTRAVSAAPLRDGNEFPLWPGDAPGSAHVTVTETVEDRSTDPKKPDRAVHGIRVPTLTAFLPKQPNGASLIIAPGGGYVREVIDKEGSEVGAWFAERGVTVFVLKYRLPGEGHEHASWVPLQDAQRAVRVVRAQAASWQLDPARIGFLGFSAGGHVAASLGTEFARKVYEPLDASDALSARPDFLLLLYPVVSMQDPVAHQGSKHALLGAHPSAVDSALHSCDLHVQSTSPPTFLALADDDHSVLPENSLRFYQALKRAQVRAELHVYLHGGHGFALRGPPE